VHLRPSPRPGVSASRYPLPPDTRHPTPDTPYRSLFDFVQRTNLAPRLVENLIAVGAFDDFGLTRRELLWQLGLFHRPAGAQAALPLPTAQDMVALSNYSAWEELRADYAILDLSPKHHPLGLLRQHLGPDIRDSKTIEEVPDGADVRIAGMVVCRQRPGTAKGVTFLLLEDEHGLLNVVVYPRTYDAHRNLVRREPFLVVDGRVQRRHGTINIVGQGFTPLWLLLGALTNKMLAPPSHDFY
jgi:error-prone DNA polymerase